MLIANKCWIFNINNCSMIEITDKILCFTDDKGKGYVLKEYKDTEQAEKAFEKLKYRIIFGEKLIDVETLLGPRKEKVW